MLINIKYLPKFYQHFVNNLHIRYRNTEIKNFHIKKKKERKERKNKNRNNDECLHLLYFIENVELHVKQTRFF